MRHIQRSILLLICLTILFASFVAGQEKNPNDLFVITVNGKQGYIDKAGKIVIKPQFRGASEFSEGLASVKIKETVDANGYDRLTQDKDNAFYNYIDKTGKIILSDFNSASSFSNGLARTYKNGSDEVINKAGKVVINSKISVLEFDFLEDLIKVQLVNSKLSKVDKTRKILSFVDLLNLDATDAQVELGFVDKKEKIIFRTKFKRLDNFKNGLARFCEEYATDAKCGYVNKTGKVIWQPTK